MRDKYGSDFEDEGESTTDSESDQSEDEDGEELTPTIDAAILRTLARIRRKDPDIYDTKKYIFGGTFSSPLQKSRLAVDGSLRGRNKSDACTNFPIIKK